jgi:hypothetical protein
MTAKNMLEVERHNPALVEAHWDSLPELLEAVACVAGILAADSEVNMLVRSRAAQLLTAIRFGAYPPVLVGIDDECDACGITSGLGIGMGPNRPVLCEVCLRGAVAKLDAIDGLRPLILEIAEENRLRDYIRALEQRLEHALERLKAVTGSDVR